MIKSNNIFISSYGNGKEKYVKENGKRVIIIHLFHLMATVKEKRKKL